MLAGRSTLEIEHERRVDAAIRAALVDAGFAATDAEYAAACAWAVEHFAPDAHTAIIWRLTGGDAAASARVYAAFRSAMHEWPAFELREGIGDVIAWLHGRGLRLGLAANQPHETLAVLDETRHRAVLPPSRGVGDARVSQAGRAPVPAVLRGPGRGAGGVRDGRGPHRQRRGAGGVAGDADGAVPDRAACRAAAALRG